MRTVAVTLGIIAILALAAPVAAQQPLQRTTLTIEAEEPARTGEPQQVVAVLTGADGTPIAGQRITVFSQLRFFDYTDTAPVGEARTDHRGAATVSHVPTVDGPTRLTAEFAGTDALTPASAAVTVTIAEGVPFVSPVLPPPAEPLLPRGVTAVWFLPLLLGVWVAIASSIYHVMRIPVEREPREA